MMPRSTVSQEKNLPSNRDQAWLESRFAWLWNAHFSDVAQLNTVRVQWGRATRTRLGTITGRGGSRTHPEVSEIKLNALLRDERIPESVIIQTLAHEIAHYTHGFCSPHPRQYTHPHRGGVIEKELTKRGLKTTSDEAEAWLKQHWSNHIHDRVGIPRLRRRKRSYYVPRRKQVSLLSYLNQILTGNYRL